jgi:hypothetical protein
MSEVSFTRDIACGCDRILELLLDHEFLTHFVTQQDPVEHDISVNADESISTITWLRSTGGMPGIARRIVGENIPITMVITSPGVSPDHDGSVNLALEGKVKGRLQASLTVQPIDQPVPNAVMAIHGPFTMNAGLLSGKASDMARDHLIVPLLGDLADLLQESCAEPPS